MIQVIVDPYCDNCQDFDAMVTRQVLFAGNVIVSVTTNVICKNADKCKNISKHLEDLLMPRTTCKGCVFTLGDGGCMNPDVCITDADGRHSGYLSAFSTEVQNEPTV